jgi:uncharacterized iron-regulated membrane protein
MIGSRRGMALFARWHIWLGWLVALPVLLWTVSGVAMVLKPIEEVRGEHLRIEQPAELFPPAGLLLSEFAIAGATEVTQRVEDGRLIAYITYADGRHLRYSQQGRLRPVDAGEARAIAAKNVRGGDRAVKTELFAAEDAPIDLRKPVSAWRVTLKDGTYVYVGRDTGQIEAIRTRWWRFYDFMWGLHIMDLQTREDSHNPFLIAFGVLALVGALLGTILLFRRRKVRPAP